MKPEPKYIPIDGVTGAFLQLLVASVELDPGGVIVGALIPRIVRAKRGRAKQLPDGTIEHESGRLLLIMEDESILNLKAPQDAKDMWLLARVRRQTADRVMAAPTGLVDSKGRPIR